jgi:glucokinase
MALTGLVNTLNLPLHVIGGGASEAWPLFAPSMFRELLLRSYVYRLTAISDDPSTVAECYNPNRTQILRAELGSEAGLLGACLFGLQATQHMHCSENQGAIR